MGLTESVEIAAPHSNVDAAPKSRKYAALGISAAALLLAALTRGPYLFYVLLRLLVCAVSVDWSRRAYGEKRTAWAWIFGGIAVLYNPLLPVHMNRSDWELVNLLTAIFFLVCIAIFRLQERHYAKLAEVTSPPVVEANGPPAQLAAHDVSAAQEAESWFQEGLRFYYLAGTDDGSAERAVECFEHGLRVLPNHRNLRVYLGKIYLWDLCPTGTWKAFEHFCVAAELGDSEAQRVLGAMYEHGHCVSQSEEMAASWYGRAAKQGDSFAQYRLGSLHLVGTGVEQDPAQAFFWYLKAAEQGELAAQLALGNMYEEGYGVDIDRSQAAYWYTKAAEGGNEDAVAALTRLHNPDS